MKSTLANLDFWGTTTSLLCAIHCAILPLLLSFGIVGTHSLLANPFFEGSIIILTILFVFFSLIRPYLKGGNHKLSVFMAIMGLALIAVHHFMDEYSVVAVTFGGLLVAIAHLYKLISGAHSHHQATQTLK